MQVQSNNMGYILMNLIFNFQHIRTREVRCFVFVCMDERKGSKNDGDGSAKKDGAAVQHGHKFHVDYHKLSKAEAEKPVSPLDDDFPEMENKYRIQQEYTLLLIKCEVGSWLANWRIPRSPGFLIPFW
ncbi:uncharacterized protein LOC113299913 isoform X2 [Papaver somniferum]|uniref:uncharacterized protein LOC113299913 isoform X2 n=1 Tax=Papaver somniferum TaxID=3469 RepID=UPI000E6FC226|nr:uncharacterized protein LOC113299913 isoform X2 [Papaver somniferum]